MLLIVGLVCLKSVNNGKLQTLLPPLLHTKTLVVLIQNGMTVALHTQTDLLLKNKATRQLIREQMMEVVGAAQHLGVKNLDASFVDKILPARQDSVCRSWRCWKQSCSFWKKLSC